MRIDPAVPFHDADVRTGQAQQTDSGDPGSDDDGLPVALNGAPPDLPPRLTVIVPTRNEEHNIGPLLERLGPAVAHLETEIVFVDDSDDTTPQAIAVSAQACAVPVRMLHRQPGARKGGLSSAVIAGARHARGAWAMVMDGDLQHPPEAAALLATTALRHDSDIVVGTRYAGSGSPADGLGGRGRIMISSWAARLAKSAFPRRLAMVSDPLSGMFAFRRSAVNLDALNPVGFKILLEILVRHPVARVAEVAYQFAPRHADDSKASLREGVRYLRHLFRLRRARLVRQLREAPPTREERIRQMLRLVAFGLIGASGVVVNTAALWFVYKVVGWNHLLGAALATQASTTWNFVLVDSLVYRKRSHGTRRGRAFSFFVMNNLLLLARLPVFQALIWSGFGVLVANAITLCALFLVRFVVSDRAIFGSSGQDRGRDPVRVLVDISAPNGFAEQGNGAPGRKRSRYLTYRYDIAGVATIGSQIMLPELEFFRAQWVADDDVDIAVRVGSVGGRSPRRRAAMTEDSAAAVIRYEEHGPAHLGRGRAAAGPVSARRLHQHH